MNLSAWVLVGAAVGALCGLFFGEHAAVLEPIGGVYVALLEMVVFPFIVSSLLHGLGSLRSATALRLLRAGWPAFLLAWGSTLAALWLLAQAIPEARPPIVVTADRGQGASQLVSLLVPANPFTSRLVMTHHFADVDGAENTDAYSGCLSLLASLPYFKEYKRRTYELLELAPGECVLDAGCGLGDDVFRMAELVPSGLVVGVDSSTRLIEQAKSDERSARLAVEFQVGDSRQLPSDDGTFTRCRIDRVLQHVPEPHVAISELVRVLKPRGILLAYDNDWGTFSITSQDKRVTRLLENAWCDSFANSWIGRELRRYFSEAGLADLRIYPSVSLLSDFDTADKVYNLTQTVSRENCSQTYLRERSF